MQFTQRLLCLASLALLIVACGKSEQTAEDKVNAAIDTFCECSDKTCAEAAAKALKSMGSSLQKEQLKPEFIAGIESRMEACAAKFGMSKSAKKPPMNEPPIARKHRLMQECVTSCKKIHKKPLDPKSGYMKCFEACKKRKGI